MATVTGYGWMVMPRIFVSFIVFIFALSAYGGSLKHNYNEPRMFHSYYVSEKVEWEPIINQFEKMGDTRVCAAEGEGSPETCTHLSVLSAEVDKYSWCNVTTDPSRLPSACTCLYYYLNTAANRSRASNQALTADESSLYSNYAKTCLFRGQKVSKIIPYGSSDFFYTFLFLSTVALAFEVYYSLVDVNKLVKVYDSNTKNETYMVQEHWKTFAWWYGISTVIILVLGLVFLLETTRVREGMTSVNVNGRPWDAWNFIFHVVLWVFFGICFFTYLIPEDDVDKRDRTAELRQILVKLWFNLHSFPLMFHCVFLIRNWTEGEMIKNSWSVGLLFAVLLCGLYICGEVWSILKNITNGDEKISNECGKTKTLIVLLSIITIFAWGTTSYPDASPDDELLQTLVYPFLVLMVVGTFFIPQLFLELFPDTQLKKHLGNIGSSNYLTGELVEMSMWIEFLFRCFLFVLFCLFVFFS